MVLYWLIAVVLDWYSTIIAPNGYLAEENPFMRAIWRDYGDMGFTVASLAFGVAFSLLYIYGYGFMATRRDLWRFAYVMVLGSFLMITMKILIAMTNLALIPYWVTGWFQFP